MRKRVGILSFALLGIALIAFAWWILNPLPDPVYNGKPLHVWLGGRLGSGGYTRDHEAENAVRHVGDKGVPLLLDYLLAKDPHLENELIDFFN